MNILIVHPCKGFYGGAEEVVVQLSVYLVNQGIDVFVATKDAPEKLRDLFERTHGTRLMGANAKDWTDFWRYTRTWLDWADVVSVHNAPAPLMTFPRKAPTVYMCNEPMELFTNWKRKPVEAFNRWWVKRSGMKVVVADSFNARRFNELYGGVPTIIPYGINYDFWSKGVTFTREPNVLRLLQVGTVTPYKNQLASVEVLSDLLAEGQNVRLTLAGPVTDEIYYEEVMEYARAKSIDHRVIPLGQQTQEQVRDLFNNHDILLHPVKGQGGWLVPFEALCAGLPVIVSQEFTGRDILLENRLGMIATDFTEIVKYAYEHLEEQLQIAQMQGKWVRDNLTWEKFGESMVKVFEEAMN